MTQKEEFEQLKAAFIKCNDQYISAVMALEFEDLNSSQQLCKLADDYCLCVKHNIVFRRFVNNIRLSITTKRLNHLKLFSLNYNF